MNINHLLAILLISSLNPLFSSSPSETREVSFYSSESVDLSSWVTVPFAYTYRSTAEKEAGEEKIEIRFPITPVPTLPPPPPPGAEEDYNPPISLGIIDDTGTSFRLDAIEIADFGLSGLESTYAYAVRELVKKGHQVTLISSSFHAAPHAATFHISWVEGNTFNYSMATESKNFYYYLQTKTTEKEIYKYNAQNEKYRYFDPRELNPADAEEHANNILESEAFFNSFIILD